MQTEQSITHAQEVMRMIEPVPSAEPVVPPDISHLVIDDGAPVDGLISEREMRLLTRSLYASWDGNGRDFAVFANVGLFYELNEPPIVPDIMLSLDVKAPAQVLDKRQNSYFAWEYGKVPDVAIEVVSNRYGGEIEKLEKYARAGVALVVVFDPDHWLSDEVVRIWQLAGGTYLPMILPEGALLPGIGLGLKLWTATFEDVTTTWLRWCDADGCIIPTGQERAAMEKHRANAEAQRAETERQRAEIESQRADAARLEADEARQKAEEAEARTQRLLERLRSLGEDA